MTERKASARWEGNLFEGHGTVSATTSGLFTGAEVTWAARTEASEQRTSPEELLAAAHSTCFSMALANELSSRDATPSHLEVEATATFKAPKITKMVLDVRAVVPGLENERFQEALAAAETSCPVSNALRGNVEIEVTATLN